MAQTCGKKNGKTKGFTLVEVIVVSVIVLILSAVAIPMYNGFVKQSREDAANNLAETAAAAANSYWRKTGVDLVSDDLKLNGKLNLYYNDKKYTVTLDGYNVKVADTEYGNTASVSYK